ncbi:hypothetical protein [Longispora urticae]
MHTRLVLLTVGLAATATLVVASPARADQVVPPTTPCTRANLGQQEITINAAEVGPVLTQFMSINIAPGTTGERTETLAVMNSVTTTIGASAEFTTEVGGKLFPKVGVKVGFTVQQQKSSTTTETNTMRWNFNNPGYYGLYKGTRAASGTVNQWWCMLPERSRGPMWWPVTFPEGNPDVNALRPVPFTTFANIEAGTVTCGESVPAGSLREKARMQLGC